MTYNEFKNLTPAQVRWLRDAVTRISITNELLYLGTTWKIVPAHNREADCTGIYPSSASFVGAMLRRYHGIDG